MNAKEPLVSIVIPCFNSARLIGDAIQSALEQDYKNTEIIVVDDGSTDDSLSVVQSFGSLIRWVSGPNRGACVARNTGLEMAKGDLIQFLDADDLLLPLKLSRQVGLALQSSMASICFSNGMAETEDQFFSWQFSRTYQADRDPVDFVLNGLLPTLAPLHFAENLRRAGGFDPSLPCAQELDLHLRMVCSGAGLSQLNDQLYVVRRQPNSVSSNLSRVLLQKNYIYQKCLKLLQANGGLSPSRVFLFGKAYASLAIDLDLAGFGNHADECALIARQLDINSEVMVWTPVWRPFAAIIGARRLARVRSKLKNRFRKTSKAI